jgi:peptidoglycan/LPS O-acetylase OafA/YrhL
MKINYRPEIDGLRAVAVLSIILYHCNLSIFGMSLFEGGFVGVDIFFTISGYLITSIILKEIYATGSFSFKHFYERRIRRIIPAFLFVIICSLPFAYILLLDSSLQDFSRSIIASIFFLSNFYFWGTNNIYGQESSLLKPFLHTWSLSIEEQFYILFPIIVLIIFTYFKKYFFKIIFSIFIISIIFATWSANTDMNFKLQIYKSFNINFFSNSNFYLLPSRLFELLLGSLLSYMKINNVGTKSLKSYKILYVTFPGIGFFLIIYSIFFYNDKMFLPSFYSLIPLTGTCLIIWYSKKDEFFTKILSSKIFIFFGLISYSLYLFHYPIFAFARIIYAFDHSIFIKILLIITTIIISIFSYYFIEKPFRNKKIISLEKLITMVLIMSVLIISFNLYILKENGIKSRLPNALQERLSNNEEVLFSKKDGQKNVVLIGDSHAGDLEFYLNEQLKKNNLNLHRFDTPFFIKKFNLVNRNTKKIDIKFINQNNNIDEFFKKESDLIIIFHQRWSIRILETYFDNREGFAESKDTISHDYYEPTNILTTSQQEREKYISNALLSEIQDILAKGHKLILVYPVPELGFNPLRLIYAKYIYNKFFYKSQKNIETLTINYEVYKERNKKIFTILDSIQHSNIYRIYPDSYFCNKQIKNRCVANNKKSIFYYDDDHLSLEGSKFIINDIVKIIKTIR